MVTIDGKELPFTYKCGSKVWPSDDPQDSPFSMYICDLCGHKMVFQQFGTFPIGHVDNIFERLKWHHYYCNKKRGNRDKTSERKN